jgi:hypothetical protein
MSRFTLCIALIAAGLLAVGCGSSSDKSSSSGDAAKPVVTPSGTAATAAQAATAKATSDAKSAKNAATAAAATATASPAAKRAIKRQLAHVKAAKVQTRSAIKALSRAHLDTKQTTPTAAAIKQLEKKARAGHKLTKADLKKLEDLQNQGAAQQKAATRKALAGVKLTQAKETGKKGTSKIPGRVAASCSRHLRAVDGALKSTSRAKALPGALKSTIKELAVLGSTSSPALTGVTGDVPGQSRTQETLAAMRSVVKPAKAYAASQSPANRAKLAKALKTLKNTAYSDVLNSCAIA